MNENIPKSDFILAFFSKDTHLSEGMKTEMRLAKRDHKIIIPIFYDVKYIFDGIGNPKGTKWDPEDFEANMEKIFQLIGL